MTENESTPVRRIPGDGGEGHDHGPDYRGSDAPSGDSRPSTSNLQSAPQETSSGWGAYSGRGRGGGRPLGRVRDESGADEESRSYAAPSPGFPTVRKRRTKLPPMERRYGSVRVAAAQQPEDDTDHRMALLDTSRKRLTTLAFNQAKQLAQLRATVYGEENNGEEPVIAAAAPDARPTKRPRTEINPPSASVTSTSTGWSSAVYTFGSGLALYLISRLVYGFVDSVGRPTDASAANKPASAPGTAIAGTSPLAAFQDRVAAPRPAPGAVGPLPAHRRAAFFA